MVPLSRIDGLQQTIMVFRLLLGVRDTVGVEDIVAGEAIEMLNAFHSLIQATSVTDPNRIIKEVDLREALTFNSPSIYVNLAILNVRVYNIELTNVIEAIPENKCFS